MARLYLDKTNSMAGKNNLRACLGVIGFAVFLLVPSFDTILKYFGVIGVAAYFLIGTILLLLGYRYVIQVVENRLSERNANILAAITFLGLIAIVAIGYPIANSGRLGGGSDADEALITAASDLLKGHYPYTQHTYLGNPISPMPGSIVFALPFILVGIFSMQNVAWFLVLFFVLRYFSQSSVAALVLVWILLLLSPTVLWNFVTGSDYATNAIYITVLMWVLIKKVLDSNAAEWQRIVLAVLLGVGLSSRSNFFLTLPLLFSMFVQNAGWMTAIKYLTVTGVSFLLITIPFWMYDPQGFTPLLAQGSKLKTLEDVLPFAAIIIPGATIILSLGLAVRKLRPDCSVFFRNCAIVQLFVLLFTCVISSIKRGYPDLYLSQAGYGMFTLFFGVISVWITRFENPRNSIAETA